MGLDCCCVCRRAFTRLAVVRPFATDDASDWASHRVGSGAIDEDRYAYACRKECASE